MSSQIIAVDISVLPPDVLSFYDQDFYKIVEAIAGVDIAKLLEFQGIRGVYSFLHTTDVFAILSISCAALLDIKKLVFFEDNENKCENLGFISECYVYFKKGK